MMKYESYGKVWSMRTHIPANVKRTAIHPMFQDSRPPKRIYSHICMKCA